MIQPLAKQAVHETIPQYPEKLEEKPTYETKELPDEQPEPAPANRILTPNEARAETSKKPKGSGRIPSPTRGVTLFTVCQGNEAHTWNYILYPIMTFKIAFNLN